MKKRQTRIRRGAKATYLVQRLQQDCLRVHRSLKHIYVQVLRYNPTGCEVLTAASTLDKEIRDRLPKGKTAQAKLVGQLVAERALAKGISKVAFHRSGFKYHGRVKALADGAREGGLGF